MDGEALLLSIAEKCYNVGNICAWRMGYTGNFVENRGEGKTGEKMDSIKYNKLVRDKMPEIIEASGKTCKVEILSDEAYLCMVDAKLDEELAEYHKDQNIEELADLLEAIYAAAIARGYSIEQLQRVRAEKAEKRGEFDKKFC